MPLKDAEDLIYRLTDPKILSYEQEVEDNLIKTLQADAAVLSHSLKYLAHKVQSPCEREAVAALELLSTIVKRGGRIVHAEVGKFRFLNELIKVVSPKYLGERTSEDVKKKTIATLFLWSQAVRYEQKIVEAYNMLKQQGIIREDPAIFEPAPPPPPRPKNPIIEDEEKAKLLRRLLQSKEPADMVAANRLIKSMVREDDQRTEKIVRRHSDLVQIKENAKVLGDMLKHYSAEGSTVQEREIMRQLFDSCETHRPRVFKLAAEIAESNQETEEGPNLADILATSDELTEVIQQYKSKGLGAEKFDTKNTRLLAEKPSVELVAVDSTASTSSVVPHPIPQTAPLIKEDRNLLDDIFTVSNVDIPGGAPILEPLGRRGNLATALSNQTLVSQTQPQVIKNNDAAIAVNSLTRKNLVDFDDVTHNFLGGLSLGERNMKGRGFPLEVKSKPSLNELQRLPAPEDKSSSDPTFSRLSSSGDDEMLSDRNFPTNGDAKENGTIRSKGLDGISVNLSDVKPAASAPIMFYQRNQINIALYLAENKPRHDCTVFVATITSHNAVPVKDFSLSFSGSKSTAVKASPFVVTDIPAFNPIFPASPLSSVLIVSKDPRESFDIRYSVAYVFNNQSISDNGFVEVPEAKS